MSSGALDRVMQELFEVLVSGSSGLLRSSGCGNKLRGEEDGLGAILETHDDPALPLEIINLEDYANTLWRHAFL